MHLVVTVPQWFWPQWIAEGDPAGEPESGEEWMFTVHNKPPISPRERLYVVAHNRLRGYAPVVRVEQISTGQWAIIRRGGAVALTIDERIRGFQGFRKPWWPPDAERAFPDWKTADVYGSFRDRIS